MNVPSGTAWRFNIGMNVHEKNNTEYNAKTIRKYLAASVRSKYRDHLKKHKSDPRVVGAQTQVNAGTRYATGRGEDERRQLSRNRTAKYRAALNKVEVDDDASRARLEKDTEGTWLANVGPCARATAVPMKYRWWLVALNLQCDNTVLFGPPGDRMSLYGLLSRYTHQDATCAVELLSAERVRRELSAFLRATDEDISPVRRKKAEERCENMRTHIERDLLIYEEGNDLVAPKIVTKVTDYALRHVRYDTNARKAETEEDFEARKAKWTAARARYKEAYVSSGMTMLENGRIMEECVVEAVGKLRATPYNPKMARRGKDNGRHASLHAESDGHSPSTDY